MMKQAAGFSAAHPEGGDEKIICLKNRHDIGLINGMFITLDEIVDENSLYFSAVVTDDAASPASFVATVVAGCAAGAVWTCTTCTCVGFDVIEPYQ